jgi:hypothetical protein
MRAAAVALVVAVGIAWCVVALPAVSHAAVVCASAPAAGSARATVPPELELLEHKLEHVRLNSIRLLFHTAFTGPTGTLTLNDVSELRRSPREAMSTSTIQVVSSSGKSSSEAHKRLEIGDTTYKYDPTATRGDGGRPW